jgi:hypothetical protein
VGTPLTRLVTPTSISKCALPEVHCVRAPNGSPKWATVSNCWDEFMHQKWPACMEKLYLRNQRSLVLFKTGRVLSTRLPYYGDCDIPSVPVVHITLEALFLGWAAFLGTEDILKDSKGTQLNRIEMIVSAISWRLWQFLLRKPKLIGPYSSRKVWVSIPSKVIGFLNQPNHSSHTLALRPTHPLNRIEYRHVRLTTLPPSMSRFSTWVQLRSY